jgi:hypothetical protein
MTWVFPVKDWYSLPDPLGEEKEKEKKTYGNQNFDSLVS